MLIALPCGLSAGGVTTWALRLCAQLPARGHACTLVLHRLRSGDTPIMAGIPAGVNVVDLSHLPPLDAVAGDVSIYAPHYARAVSELSSHGPVVISPNLMGDCYAIVAALSQSMPKALRTVGWCHLDSDYDRRVLSHYEPMMHAFVGVSEMIHASLTSQLPGRAGDIVDIPYGVRVPGQCPAREPANGRPLRMIYHGRVDENVKRISALIHMVDALVDARVPHTLTIVGDGPAAHAIDHAVLSRPSMRRLPPVPPDAIAALLHEHDLFVLPSRVEGLSVAMLEAMAHGCVPVVTQVRSGAAQAISHKENGVLVAAENDAPAENVGRAMALALGAIDPGTLPVLSRNAWKAASERFSLSSHADAVSTLLERVAAMPARAWPTTRACSFTCTGPGGSGTVPADAASRLTRAFESLGQRRVVIHATGRHTMELGQVLAMFSDRIVGFADDDPSRQGSTIWGWPIVSPCDAAGLGATDVIISSWLHQEAIWARRGDYERQGLRVHRLYAPASEPALAGVQASSRSAPAASGATRA